MIPKVDLWPLHTFRLTSKNGRLSIAKCLFKLWTVTASYGRKNTRKSGLDRTGILVSIQTERELLVGSGKQLPWPAKPGS